MLSTGIQEGQYALTAGNYAEALTYYNNALALDSKYGSALSGKAVALNGLLRYTEAIRRSGPGTCP